MSISLGFNSTTIGLFKFEPFSYVWTYPGAASLRVTASEFVTPNLSPSGSNLTFASLVGYGLTSTGESIGIEALDGGGATLAVSSNVVTVGNARFVTDASLTPLEGQRFVFYKNETITPVTVIAAFTLATPPTSTPTLPNGLGFVPSSPSTTYTLSGTPTVQTPIGTYSIVGSNVGSTKLARSVISIVVNGERIVLTLAGTGVSSQMQIGTAIAQQVLTAQYPPYPWSGANLRYTFTALPGGLEFADVDGIPRSSPFTPPDSLSTLVLRGTPSLAGAKQFAALGIRSADVLVTATRTIQPLISNSQVFSFSFAETILFDDVTFDTFYAGVPVDPSRNFVRAETYFSDSSASITSIISPDLRADLSLTFVPSEGRAYLSGTPTTTGSNNFTIRATNSTPITGDTVVSVVVAEDSVTLTPPTDVCYNFILSRPVSFPATGYYPAPLTWRATAASGRPVSFSAPALVGTGLSLDASGGSATLSGIPDTVTPLQNLRVTATAVGSGATAFRDSSFAVVPDVFTFNSVPASSRTFIQNKAITPFQIAATTLSERSVISYASQTLPDGVTISTTGLVSGTPLADTGGTASITASTGYASGSQSYSYSITPDVIIFELSPTSYTYSPGDAVSIDVNGVSYSGASVSNYGFSNFTPSYGLSIAAQTGIVSGNLIDGVPPGALLPVSRNFEVTASAGQMDGSLSMVIFTTNPIVDRSFLLAHGGTPGLYVSDNGNSIASWEQLFNGLPVGTFTSLVRKNATLDSNTYVIAGDVNTGLYRSTNGDDWTRSTINQAGYNGILSPAMYSVVKSDRAASEWIGVGTFIDLTADNVRQVGYFVSSNDGVDWAIRLADPDPLNPFSTNPLPPVAPRISTGTENYYTVDGLAFSAKGTTRIIGGGLGGGYEPVPFPSIVALSDNEGASWNSYEGNGALTKEIATFNIATDTWIMAGSSFYTIGGTGQERGGVGGYAVVTETLKWSEDQGVSWNTATGAVPDVGTYEVAYGCNSWFATGLNQDAIDPELGRPRTATTRFVYSFDGKVWSNIVLDVSLSAVTETALPEIGPLWYNEDTRVWNAIVNPQPPPDESYPRLYQRTLSSDMSGGWTLVTSGITPFNTFPARLTSFDRAFVRTGAPTTVTIQSVTTVGPTLVSPTETTLLFYQYVSIAPIVFSATGVGTVYYFVETADLPPGLLFDPITATLSGKSVVLGNSSFDIFLKDEQGVTRVTVRVTTVLPTVTRPTTTAAAYTSLVRQYTEVNAARNAENSVVYPGESRGIGAFTRPTPPNEITQTVDPSCFSTSNCT